MIPKFLPASRLEREVDDGDATLSLDNRARYMEQSARTLAGAPAPLPSRDETTHEAEPRLRLVR